MTNPDPDEIFKDLNWDDIRIFQFLAESLNIGKTALDLQLSPTTVTRAIKRLETIVSTSLIDRTSKGCNLTEKGKTLYQLTSVARSDIHRAMRVANHQSPEMKSTVRLAISDGVGNYWILPRLAKYIANNPKLLIDYRCDMEPSNAARLQTDFSLQLLDTTASNVVSRRIATVHGIPYASRDYIARKGHPKTIAEMLSHVGMDLVAPAYPANSIANALNLPSLDFAFALRLSSLTTTIRAVQAGIGLGGAPTYMGIYPDLVALEIQNSPILVTRDLYIVYDPTISKIPHIADMMDWVEQQFDPQKYPWFRREFIHPKEMTAEYEAARAEGNWPLT